MPEPVTSPSAAAPAAPDTSSTPSQVVSPSESSTPAVSAPSKGIDGLLADLDKAIQPKSVQEKSEPKTTDKPDAKPAKTPDASKTAPKTTPDDLWGKAPEKLRNEYYKLKRESDERISKYEQRIKEIESKPKETQADMKLVEEYQARIRELEERSAQADYRNSSEFQKNYVQRWQNEFKDAASEVSNLKVKEEDADGNERFRPATDSDFARLVRMAPGEQDEAAVNMFGHYAPRVMARILELKRIERAADNAIAEHSKNIEFKSKEAELNRQRSEKEYLKAFESSTQQLQEKYPQFFSPDESDSEVSDVLKQGYEFVDKVMQSAEAMKTEERAAYSAVLRARAGAFPRVAMENARLKAKLESLESELSKFRKSDPGSAEGRGSTPAPERPAGISDLVKAFQK